MESTKRVISKTISRLAAVQILYSFEINNESYEDNSNILSTTNSYIENFNKQLDSDTEFTEKLNKSFIHSLIAEIFTNLEDIDSTISSFLKNKNSAERMHLIMKIILRCAICEMLYLKSPHKVVIDEYIKISKDFFDESEINFVNAILDNIHKSNEREIDN